MKLSLSMSLDFLYYLRLCLRLWQAMREAEEAEERSVIAVSMIQRGSPVPKMILVAAAGRDAWEVSEALEQRFEGERERVIL